MEKVGVFAIRLMVFLIETCLAEYLDQGEKVQVKKKEILVVIFYLFCTVVIGRKQEIFFEMVSSFFWGSFAAAAYSDWQIKKAYDFMLWAALFSGIFTFLFSGQDIREAFVEIVLFFLLQGLVFGRMYGRADCMGFCACAVYLAASGQGFLEALCLMSAALLLLFLVQLLKKNVSKKGNLKEPRAFLPYIAAALLLFC